MKLFGSYDQEDLAKKMGDMARSEGNTPTKFKNGYSLNDVPAVDQCLAILKEKGPMTSRGMSDALGVPQTSITSTLIGGVKRGRFVRDGTSRPYVYRLPS